MSTYRETLEPRPKKRKKNDDDGVLGNPGIVTIVQTTIGYIAGWRRKTRRASGRTRQIGSRAREQVLGS